MNKFLALDVFKLILSFMIVALHNDPFGIVDGYRYPLLLLPVLIFFIISSFLFFYKRNILNINEQKIQLQKFVLRNGKLYLGWFIILLPFTILIRGYFIGGEILEGLFEILTDTIFGSTFRSSWFLVANMLGIVALCYLNNKQMLVIGILCYIICALRTNYGFLPQDGLFNTIIDKYPGTFYQSFPIAFIWTFLGKILAEKHSKWKNIALGKLVIGGVFSIILLFVEYQFLKCADIIITPGYCIFMLPTCTLIFMIVCNIRFLNRYETKILREISTVIYCSSTTIGWVIIVLLRKIGVEGSAMPISLLVYAVIIMCSIMLTFMIRKLQNYKKFALCAYLK